MPDPTTHFSWAQPDNGGDLGAWGPILNALHDLVDADLRANAGKPSEQLLILAVGQNGAGWGDSDSSIPLATTLNDTATELIIPIGERLRVGQRITAFTSYGQVQGTASATVKLRYVDTAGARTEVSAGHSLPGALGETTTSGLTHDVAAGRGYYIIVTPSGLSAGSVNVAYVRLTITKSP